MPEPHPTTVGTPPRRNFLKQFVTGVLGAVVGLVPGLAGLLVILDPLKRKSTASGDALLVTRFSGLPADGIPRRFQVFADRVDAWNTYKNIAVGAVYLRRGPDNQVTALNASCPHAGCSVSFVGDRGHFLCPCHDSLFSVDGAIADPKSPSPRALDALEVEVRNNEEVWVKFRNFQPGHKAQLPVT
jgi:menaquinol-cytochrome c reductase iron-sulfur subunit